MVSGKPRCLNETKERIVPEDLFDRRWREPDTLTRAHARRLVRVTTAHPTCRAGLRAGEPDSANAARTRAGPTAGTPPPWRASRRCLVSAATE
jgi:hypothetical protein